MKKTSLFLSLITLYTLTSSSNCHKSNSPTNQLPPETHAGLNTMGCLVDGVLFIPQTKSTTPGSAPGQFAAAGYNIPGPGISFHWTDFNDSSLSWIDIHVDSVDLQAGAMYTLGAPPDTTNLLSPNTTAMAQWALYYSESGNVIPSFTHTTNSQVTGQIILDYYDGLNGLVAGRFSFDAVNKYGDTVHIREGRFDMAIQR
jgi:hypothetical protein